MSKEANESKVGVKSEGGEGEDYYEYDGAKVRVMTQFQLALKLLSRGGNGGRCRRSGQ